VALVDLDEPLAAIDTGDHDRAVLVLRAAGSIVGQLDLPAEDVSRPGRLRAAIPAAAEAAAAEARLRARIARALAGTPAQPPAEPGVAVIVCTRDRPRDLERCLGALGRLRPPAREIIVVDNAGSDPRTAEVCATAAVTRIEEPLPGQTRARNRGLAETRAELVAFTDDDCMPDPDWLDGLGELFADPLLAAVTGPVSPRELGTPAQYAFERHGGFDRRVRRVRLDAVGGGPLATAAAAGAGANMIVRREAVAGIGAFAEDLGPGTPARAGDDTDLFRRLLRAGPADGA
jgi:cellulose synthase/poly-beta-1,6-N-acetylglucosamine synthase-like glycosyltransferase